MVSGERMLVRFSRLAFTRPRRARVSFSSSVHPAIAAAVGAIGAAEVLPYLVVTAHIDMAHNYMYRYGLYSYGTCSYGLYSYGFIYVSH